MLLFGRFAKHLLQDKQHPDGGVNPVANSVRKSVQTEQRFMTGSYRPETLDLEARTVEMVFTTGEAGVRYDWWEDVSYLEELEISENALRTERLDKGLPLFDNHRTWEGVKGQHGVTEAWRIENGELIGTVRFAKDDESDVVFQKVADGITRSCSLGYRVYKFQHIKAGEENKLDTLRAVDWEATELSLAPIPFEKGASNGVRSERNDNEPTNMVEILTEDENMLLFGRFARNLKQDKQDPAGGVAPVAAPAPSVSENTPEPQQRANDPAPAPQVVEKEVRGDIRSFLDAANAAGLDQSHALEAYEGNRSIEDYRASVLEELGKRSHADTPVVLGTDQRNDHSESVRKGAEDYINYLVGNVNTMSDAARQFRGARMLDVGTHLASMKGRNAQLAGFHPLEQATRAFHSSTDFPLLLENVMNKSLETGYQETPRTFLGLGRRSSLNDFRYKNVYKMGDAPDLKKLNESGRYEFGSFSEAKEQYRLHTYARAISFTRQLLINDDMDALGSMPRMFGQAGSRSESDIIWGLLLNYDFENNKAANHKMFDNKAFFHSDHNNLLTGANSAFSKAALSELRKAGRKMKTLDGKFMNLMWNTLVAPEDLETDMEEVLFNTIMPTKDADTNSFKNKFELRIEPRLAVVSPSAWYAFTNMLPAFEYAYLAGEEGMYTETVNGTDVDGMVMKVRKDFGAGYIEERGAFKMAGA